MKSKIKIMSREEAKQLVVSGFPPNTAIISFYDPIDGRGVDHIQNYKPMDYSKVCNRVFMVAVHDIDIETLSEFGLTFERYFPEAQKLARFIKQAVCDGLDIICQCEYGQSRSAACAAAIKEYFDQDGIKIFADYRYYPNQMIFNKLLDALRCDDTKAPIGMKGPFWVLEEEDRMIAYPVPLSQTPVPSHKDVWLSVCGIRKKTWSYYPRGRVEIRNGKVIVFANSYCYRYAKLEKEIREAFHLGDLPIKFKADNSSHYTMGVFEEEDL